MAMIDIQGVHHAYELTASTNSPSALVFIHGWLLSRNYWSPITERLAPHYQCLVYDLRGFGDSQPGTGPRLDSVSLEHSPGAEVLPPGLSGYSPRAYAYELGLLLDKLDIQQAWLVGHSLGGTIALWGAHQLSDRVQGVICLNAGGGIYLKEEFEKFRKAGQQIVKFRPRWFQRLPFMDLMFSRASVAPPISRRWGRQRLVDFLVADTAAALGTLLDSTTEAEVHHLPKVVSQLPQPVHFIAGADDPIMEPQYVRHLASFHPLFEEEGANVVEIPQCGHMAMIEQPDAVAAAIRESVARYEVEPSVMADAQET